MAGDRKIKVLVVDDERVIADTLVQILNQHGFEAAAVYSGTAAVDQATLVAPDILFTDVVMEGGINGIDAAIAIRQICPDCRVLLFSGDPATEDLLAVARTQGHAFNILAKPLHPAETIEHLSRMAQGGGAQSDLSSAD
ncbi:MAG: response regulator [Terracidiphilus sp.]